MVKLFLDAGAIVDGQSMIAAANVGSLEIISELVKTGVSINSTDSEKRTPVILATIKNDTELLSGLLKYKPNLQFKDSSGKTASDYALEKGYLEVYDLIGVDGINLQDKLLVAIEQNDLVMVERLLKIGADPNGVNADREPFVVSAVSNNNLELVKLLIAHDVDLSVANQSGDTLLTIANRNYPTDMIALLEENDAPEQADFTKEKIIGYWKRRPLNDGEESNVVAKIEKKDSSYYFTQIQDGEENIEEITKDWDDSLQVGPSYLNYDFEEDLLSAFHYKYERVSQSVFQSNVKEQHDLIAAEKAFEEAKANTFIRLKGYWTNTAEPTDDYHFVKQISVEESQYAGWIIRFHENGHTGSINSLSTDSIEAIEGNTVYIRNNDLQITFLNNDKIHLYFDFLKEGEVIELTRD